MTESSPTPAGPGHPFDAEEFARQTVYSIETGDAYASVLEKRVIRLEEIIAARWPRSIILRWRLARELRASVARWDPDYVPEGDFVGRRYEAVSHEADAIMSRQDRARARGWPEPGTGSEPEQAPVDGDPGAGFLP